MTDDLGNTLYGRRKTYFPNVNTGAGNQQFPLAPGVAEGQARMDQLAATGTYKSRRDDFRNKYPQFANPSAQQALQNFDVNQAYAQGYGAPSPTIQQGLGGPYRVAGGVATPFTPRNAFQRFGSDLATGARGIGAVASGIGTFAANLFGGQGGSQATQYGQNVSTGQMPNAALQAVENFQQSGNFFQQAGPTKPFKYFYD